MHNLIGMNIRLFRVKYGIQIDEIVKETGLKRNTIYKIERGDLFGKSLISYIFFLKNRNADLNKIFDTGNKEELLSK